MAEEATPEEINRARATVDRFLLVSLWQEVIGWHEKPAKAGDALAERVTREFEDMLLLAGGRDAEVTRHLSIDEMETTWRWIRLRHPSPKKPIADAPAPAKRKRKGKKRE